jgi:hypothetical protein
MTDETERLTQRYETEDVEQTKRLDDSENPDVVETYVRFGPGVPAQAVPAPDRATAIWRGEVRPVGDSSQRAAEGRSRRWIMPLTVLILVIAVLIYFFWGRTSDPVAVSSVSVKAPTATVTCGQTTNGGSGKLTYQWVRSDGTTSDVLSQNMNKGQHQTTVALLWNFDGYGSLDATATLHILSPGNASGSAAFHYSCIKP